MPSFRRDYNMAVNDAIRRTETLLYHFVLTCSNWEHVTLCCGEEFASLSAGCSMPCGRWGQCPSDTGPIG